MAEITAMQRRTVLVVDDDDALRGSLRRYLRRAWNVVQATDCAEAFEALEQTEVDAVLVDIRLPDGLGFEVADRAARLQPRPGVIIMTGDGQIDDAIQALQHGAADFLLKPFSLDALDRALGRIFQAFEVEASPSHRSADHVTAASWRDRHAPELLGNAPELLAAVDIVRRVADTDVSVLISGESGTGKELIARALRQGGGRREKPFVTVNCAAIPGELLESELFGHEKGVFTGAVDRREGRFAMADGGTMFLDEIGEMPLGLQAKILRVLQEKTVTPIGGRPRPVDVRILAATNRDLEEMVESGRFREDLLYRLNVIPIVLPPLRDRPGDVKLLTNQFIDRANRRRSRSISGVRADAMDLMMNYEWPGNVRQLENTIERMVVLRTEGELTPEDLPPKVRRAAGVRRTGPVSRPVLPDEGIDLRHAAEQFENALILQALERTAGNKNKAAELLRMNRTTLVERLKKRGIRIGK